MRLELHTLVDDFDGSEAVRTRYLALDGRRVRLDLSAEHDRQLLKALRPWLDRGQPQRAVRARPRPAGAVSEIRTWARSNGYSVTDAGPIPRVVLAAYAAAFAR